MYALGKGFYIQEPQKVHTVGKKQVKTAPVHDATVVDTASQQEHQKAAQAALDKAQQLLRKQPHVLVLDEVCNALDDKLITFKQLETLLKKRVNTHVVLTGRNASPELIEQADLVTHMEHVKHPYDSGVLAIAGLDF